MKALELPSNADLGRLYAGFYDDFTIMLTADRWTTILTDSGTAAVTDALGGILAIIPSDGTVADNDEAYVHTTWELFKFAADQPLIVEAGMYFTEGATNIANVLFGLMSGSAADHLLDDGGGPAASYDGAVFFKVDGGLNWNCEVARAATMQTTELTAANSLDKTVHVAGSTVYHRLRIESRPTSSTTHDVSYWIDGVCVCRYKDVVLTSAAEMDVIFGQKNGAVTTVETVNVDYCFAYQKRAY